MSFDETMQLLGVLGSWLAAIGTITATIVALWFSRRAERVRLKTTVDTSLRIGGGSQEEVILFAVTNIGERPVTITSIGWCVGKRRRKRHAFQSLGTSSLRKCPAQIEHGETAQFVVSFAEIPTWKQDFARDFLRNYSIKTLRALIHTSVGHTEEVVPGKTLLRSLQEEYS